MADRMTATPSQEWTEQDERDVQTFALRGFDAVIGTAQGVRCARELNRQRDEVARLRAENERLTKRMAPLSEKERWDVQRMRDEANDVRGNTQPDITADDLRRLCDLAERHGR